MSRIPVAAATALVPRIQWTSPTLGWVSSTISSARIDPDLIVMLLLEHRDTRRRHLLTTEHTGQLTARHLTLHADPRPATANLLPQLAPHLTFETTLELLTLSNHPTLSALPLLVRARELPLPHRDLALQLIAGGFTGSGDALITAVLAATH